MDRETNSQTPAEQTAEEISAHCPGARPCDPQRSIGSGEVEAVTGVNEADCALRVTDLRSGQKPVAKKGRAMVSGLIGLVLLIALAMAGRNAGAALHLTLPGPVIGLALLATVVLLLERFHAWSHQHFTLHLEPVSRLLVSHLGLLFVPAGVGIITEGDALRKEWLPLVAALAGSTLIGLVATGWFMHRFTPKSPDSKP